MEHIFPPKTIALVANTTVTINWTAPDIAQRFPESIIKKPVAIRFSCTTTATNSVNCGVRYSTLTKDYLVAERKTLFFIPPSASVDVTPASKPALGSINRDIVSFSLDLTSPVSGNATIILIVDDDPPPLSSEAGELIGLDAKFARDYLSINQGIEVNAPVGINSYLVYTVPAGKRFQLTSATITVQPTPSFPSLVRVTLTLFIAAVAYPLLSVDSLWDNPLSVVYSGTVPILNGGDTARFDVINTDTTASQGVKIGYIGQEIF